MRAKNVSHHAAAAENHQRPPLRCVRPALRLDEADARNELLQAKFKPSTLKGPLWERVRSRHLPLSRNCMSKYSSSLGGSAALRQSVRSLDGMSWNAGSPSLVTSLKGASKIPASGVLPFYAVTM